MSRTNPVIVAGRELTQEEVAQRAMHPDDKLYGGLEEIKNRILQKFNVVVSDHYLRRSIANGTLRSRVIRHTIHVSQRDMFDFIILSHPPRGGDSESASA